MEESVLVEHVLDNHYPIHWKEITVLDHYRRQELLVKEALNFQMTPSEERLNKIEDWKCLVAGPL